VRVAYLVSRFPKLSETFILDEILALERRGVAVELFSLLREREPVAHPEAERLAQRCTVVSAGSPLPWFAQLVWLARAPRALLSVWARVLWEHRGSLRLLARAIAVVSFASLYALRMQRRGVEHVHAHWATHPALGAWVVHRLTGVSYSFTTHADDLFVQQTMLAEKAGRAAFVVAISEYNRRFLIGRLGTSARIEVVHCGVSTRDLQPLPEPDGPFRIACVARLEEKKGQVHLVDACAALARRRVDVHCDLIGDGRDRIALAARISALGLVGRVRLHGPQPRDRVLELMAAAHAVVLPGVVTATGRRDGIPIALMEAMGLGRPVVASAVSGVPELVEHERTGLLTGPGDVDALVVSLMRLAVDPALRRRLGAAGRRHVEAEFDRDRCADRLCELLADAIAAPPRYEPGRWAASEASG
jgi:glycosyltransferase involved in cell wall biosynthesis